MTIGYIFSFFGDGGAEENALLIAQKAKQSGYRVFFILSKYTEASEKKLKDSKIEIINLPMESSFNILSVRRSAIDLKKIIENNKIDIIHSHMLREHSIAVISKIIGAKFKLIRTFHRFDQFNIKMKPLMSAYRRYTDAFIAISEQMNQYLIKNGLKNNIYLIKNGVKKVETKKHDMALGYIGRLTKEKGIFNFIKSNTEILQDTKLIIAGDGPDYDEINKYANENKLNVELLGKVVKKADFYKRISVLILPSETEVLPLVVLEAYSCGLPVVAFKIKSLKSLIEKDNGLLVDYPNYSKLGIEAKKVLLKSSSYYMNNIKKYKSEYSIDIMWKNTDKLYQDLNSIREK